MIIGKIEGLLTLLCVLIICVSRSDGGDILTIAVENKTYYLCEPIPIVVTITRQLPAKLEDSSTTRSRPLPRSLIAELFQDGVKKSEAMLTGGGFGPDFAHRMKGNASVIGVFGTPGLDGPPAFSMYDNVGDYVIRVVANDEQLVFNYISIKIDRPAASEQIAMKDFCEIGLDVFLALHLTDNEFVDRKSLVKIAEEYPTSLYGRYARILNLLLDSRLSALRSKSKGARTDEIDIAELRDAALGFSINHPLRTRALLAVALDQVSSRDLAGLEATVGMITAETTDGAALHLSSSLLSRSLSNP